MTRPIILNTSDVFDGPVSRFDLRGRKHDFAWCIQTVPLSSRLVASQPTLAGAIVDRYVRNQWHRHTPVQDWRPILVERGGVLIIYDGHHRIAAALRRGDSHLACWVGRVKDAEYDG